MGSLTHSDGRLAEPGASALIRTVAAKLLTDGLDELVAESTRQILNEEPTYTAASVKPADISRQTRRTLSLSLHRLAGLDIPDDLRSAAFETGRRRAEQGLPLTSLLHSFRIDLRMLWEAIVAEVHRDPQLQHLDILDQHSLLWEALEANTADVVEAYHLVERRRALRVDQNSRDAFKSLLERGEHDTDAVSAFAAHAELPKDGAFLVFAIAGPEPHETLHILDAHLRVRRLRFFATVIKDELCGVVLHSRAGAVDASTLPRLDEASVAVIDAIGLARVPRALRAVRRAAQVQPRGAPANLEANLLFQIARLEPDLLGAVLANRMQGLAHLTESESRGIWELLDALARSDGTLAGLASTSFRHRNTVRARLERLHEATGLDPRAPADATLLVLAAALRSVSD